MYAKVSCIVLGATAVAYATSCVYRTINTYRKVPETVEADVQDIVEESQRDDMTPDEENMLLSSGLAWNGRRVPVIARMVRGIRCKLGSIGIRNEANDLVVSKVARDWGRQHGMREADISRAYPMACEIYWIRNRDDRAARAVSQSNYAVQCADEYGANWWSTGSFLRIIRSWQGSA